MIMIMVIIKNGQIKIFFKNLFTKNLCKSRLKKNLINVFFLHFYCLRCSPTRMTSLYLILDEMIGWEMRVQSAGWDEWRGVHKITSFYLLNRKKIWIQMLAELIFVKEFWFNLIFNNDRFVNFAFRNSEGNILLTDWKEKGFFLWSFIIIYIFLDYDNDNNDDKQLNG